MSTSISLTHWACVYAHYSVVVSFRCSTVLAPPFLLLVRGALLLYFVIKVGIMFVSNATFVFVILLDSIEMLQCIKPCGILE